MTKWNLPPMQLPHTPSAPLPLKIAETTADLKKGVGSYALAVVAPKEGPIDVKPGTPVVLVAKRLWESPTVKRFVQIITGAWIAFAGYVGVSILAKGDLWEVDWMSVLKQGANVAAFSALAAYGIVLKKSDNDPTVK